jgi:predicted nucleic acid-binding protein
VKIVLDTNVLVSGLLKSKGNPAKVLELALTGAVQAYHDKRLMLNTRKSWPGLISILTRGAFGLFWLNLNQMVFRSLQFMHR